jgi:superfamily I DNA/RNA helicase
MNNKKIPEFVPGPPGTGKTHRWLKNSYSEFLQKYPWDRIVVLSHTRTAAKEIIKAVDNLPKLKNVPDSQLEDQICTIHSYFRGEYVRLQKYEKKEHEKFCSENIEMKFWNKPKSWEKHPLYEFSSHAHGRELTFDAYWTVCDPHRYEPYKLHTLKELKTKYDKFREDHKKLSFEDMIDNFLFHAEIPTDIDILIVDEAQDCSRPQIKALQKAATFAKRFIFVGDADQTIHEYAGSDPNYFYKLASTKESKDNELTEGLRCGRTINQICKKIILPVWKKWGVYAERIWTPAKENPHDPNSKEIIGKSYWIPSLGQSCIANDILIEKILNTNETFLFTYRGNPTHKHINQYLEKNGIDYKLVSNDRPHVSRGHFRCFKTWQNFLNDKVSKRQIMDYWPLMGKSVKVHGKGSIDHIKSLIDKEYNIQELIDMDFILPETKKCQSFSEVLTYKDLIPKIPFIKKVLANRMDTEKMPRVQHDTIHKVKGLTFDNVIVDLSVYHTERGDEPIRLAYTAYSRGKNDCWSIGSSSPEKMSLAGIQDNRRYYLE